MIKLTLLGGSALSMIMLSSPDPLSKFVGLSVLVLSALGALGIWYSRRKEQIQTQSHQTWDEIMNEYRGRQKKEGSVPPNRVRMKY